MKNTKTFALSFASLVLVGSLAVAGPKPGPVGGGNPNKPSGDGFHNNNNSMPFKPSNVSGNGFQNGNNFSNNTLKFQNNTNQNYQNNSNQNFNHQNFGSYKNFNSYASQSYRGFAPKYGSYCHTHPVWSWYQPYFYSCYYGSNWGYYQNCWYDCWCNPFCNVKY